VNKKKHQSTLPRNPIMMELSGSYRHVLKQRKNAWLTKKASSRTFERIETDGASKQRLSSQTSALKAYGSVFSARTSAHAPPDLE
jgi:hypothetical protein